MTNSRWGFDLEQQLKIDNDVRRFKGTSTELGVLYNLSKAFSLKGNYRYYIKSNTNNTNRIAGDILYKLSIKQLALSINYRLRFQHEIEENTHHPETIMRNSFLTSYGLSKFVDPFLSYESFYRFNQWNRFIVNRYTAGLNWKLGENMDLVTFYRVDRDFGDISRKTVQIIGWSLIYGFKT